MIKDRQSVEVRNGTLKNQHFLSLQCKGEVGDVGWHLMVLHSQFWSCQGHTSKCIG